MSGSLYLRGVLMVERLPILLQRSTHTSQSVTGSSNDLLITHHSNIRAAHDDHISEALDHVDFGHFGVWAGRDKCTYDCKVCECPGQIHHKSVRWLLRERNAMLTVTLGSLRGLDTTLSLCLYM